MEERASGRVNPSDQLFGTGQMNAANSGTVSNRKSWFSVWTHSTGAVRSNPAFVAIKVPFETKGTGNNLLRSTFLK